METCSRKRPRKGKDQEHKSSPSGRNRIGRASLHRSNTGFCIDDVKNALENARVIGKSDQDLGHISSDDTFKHLSKDEMIERKNHLAAKWQRLATKIMKQ